MASLRRAQPLVFPAVNTHTATVIFSHGLGDTGHGWASAVENWRRRQRLDEIKFILPHAPEIPITCNVSIDKQRPAYLTARCHHLEADGDHRADTGCQDGSMS